MDIFLISFIYIVISMALIIYYCKKPKLNVFWLVAVFLFAFGTAISTESAVSSVMAFVTALIVLLFARSNPVLYGIAAIYIILGSMNDKDIMPFSIFLSIIISFFVLFYIKFASHHTMIKNRPKVSKAEN